MPAARRGEQSESFAYELLETDQQGDSQSPRASDEVGRVSEDDLRSGETDTLPRIPGDVPWTSYIIALVEFAERASYYGVGGVINNFVQRPLPDGGSGTGAPPVGSQLTPGALGLGLQFATVVNVIFVMLAFCLPLVGGALSDLKWGKFRTIAIGTVVGAISHLLFVYAALPSVLQAGAALLPFLLGILLLAMSAGAIKSAIAPLMAEQYPHFHDYITVLPSGQRVVVDREATIQKIMSAYYASINVGAFTAIASTFAEKYVGFWLAYLIPGIIFCLMPPLLYFVRPHLRASPRPTTSASTELVGLFKYLTRPQARYSETNEYDTVTQACKIFLFFIVFGVGDLGLNSLMVSLVGSMTTDGLPNDFLGFFNPLVIVTGIPILNKFLYPALSARSIPFGPVKRVVTGFLLVAGAMLWCAFLQYKVYKTSPCGYRATSCDVGSGVSPISAWWFIPAPIMTGLSEALAMVSAMELAYTMSPPALRSMAHAVFLSTQAASSVIVLLLTPIMRDPLLVFPFLLTSIMAAVAAGFVWRLLKHLDHERS